MLAISIAWELHDSCIDRCAHIYVFTQSCRSLVIAKRWLCHVPLRVSDVDRCASEFDRCVYGGVTVAMPIGALAISIAVRLLMVAMPIAMCV